MLQCPMVMYSKWEPRLESRSPSGLEFLSGVGKAGGCANVSSLEKDEESVSLVR